MVSEQRNVFHSLAQGRDRHLNHIQPVVKIFAQLLVSYGFARIPVRSRDETHVDYRFLCLAANAPYDSILKDSQHLRLERHRHLGELVEEQRTAVGHLEEAHLLTISPGERSFAVAEHLRLE